jgi:acetyltransferase-like isoleucine patch superfamily enzyme
MANTGLGRFLAKLWNVPLGRHVSFYGVPHFLKHPTASITIGAGCQFRSAEWSNGIGINRRCFLSARRDAEIQIGNDCGFSGTTIDAYRQVRIGDRVLCGANCTILDSDMHPLDAADRASNLEPNAIAIDIGDDVFLGMNVVVLKGVRIGSGTVVAANSVVSKSLPSNVLAAGVPAKPIKSIVGANASRAELCPPN